MSEKVTVICGTNRPGSNSRIVSNKLKSIVDGLEIDVDLLDLHDLPNDFVYNNEVISQGTPEYASLIDRHITATSKFVFVLPEYNGSFPGVVKAFIDSFPPRNIAGKSALLVGVSSGRAGNLRGMEHFTGVLNYLKVHVWPFKMAIDHVDKKIDASTKEFKDEHSIKFLNGIIRDFLAK